ncbi:MAG TPA: response regulator [Victivallales bacterium]|nr:response regulator [Victivallales bacterium]
MIRRQKILIVDEKASNLTAFSRILEDIEADIITADNGNDAVRLAFEQDIDLILLDIHIPGMTGYDTIQLIKKEEKTKYLPIVFLTSKSTENVHIIEGIESGAVDFIEKPVSDKILICKTKLLLEMQKNRIELEKKNREIADEKAYSEELLATMPDGLWIIDFNGNTIDVNQSIVKMLGYTDKEDLIKKNPVDISPEKSSIELKRLINGTLNGENMNGEFKAIKKNGENITISVKTACMKDIDGKISGGFAVIRDITERIKMEEQIRKTNKDLKDKIIQLKNYQVAKSRFYAAINHEIRTPLNAVLGLTEILDEEIKDAEYKKYTTKIFNSGKLLLNVVNDILDFSKFEAGKKEVNEEDFSLSETVDVLNSVLQIMATDKGLDFTVESSSNMDEILFGDNILLTKLLLNLCNNAIKYTNTGRVLLKIETIESEDLFIKYLFTVSDTGIGILKQNLNKLFTPFTQFEKSQTIEGTGLGLAIVKEIVDLMKGDIYVDSEIGEGSRFSVKLSFKKQTIIQASRRMSTVTKSKMKSTKFLIVDDVKDNQLLIKVFLSKLGIESIDIAENGRRAVNFVRKKEYDIILMDSNMPGMDGREASRQIREITASVKKPVIISLTANTTIDRELSIKSGIDYFIFKPINFSNFKKIIDEVITENVETK